VTVAAVDSSHLDPGSSSPQRLLFLAKSSATASTDVVESLSIQQDQEKSLARRRSALAGRAVELTGLKVLEISSIARGHHAIRALSSKD
jgi:hypothetical protein